MNAEEYRRGQDGITAQILTAILNLLRSIGPRPVSDQQFVALVNAVYPAVTRSRTRSYELAREFYADQHPATPPDVPEPHYERAALEKALDRTVKARLAGLDDLEADEATTVARTAASSGASAVARHVEMAGRDTITATTRADRRALGWARMGTGRENCAFCTMLISRGPVYKSARSAGGDADNQAAMAAATATSMLALMNEWHDGCDCIAVPVFDDNDWPGRAQHEAAEKLWLESTSGVYGAAKLNAFRQALAGSNA